MTTPITSSTPRTYDTGTPQVLAESADGIATLTFNNPEKRNALSRAMQAGIPRALAATGADDDVRVLVVRGAGDKAFMSGADISEFKEHRTEADDRAAFEALSNATGRAWIGFDKPIIAMIRGFCMGGGLLTSLNADIRIASDDSQFGVPAARLGLGYAHSGVEALASVVGRSAAAEILFSARRLSADEAVRIGLVNRVVAVDELDGAVYGLAAQIAANAPLTVTAIKASLRELRRPAGDRDTDRVAELVDACFRSSDYLEGQAAFAERRPPRFEGR
jgi:enoyl-CoA hydratase/carnithine racemase